jgi:anti-sigma regulatory factor (Ser/Thr protein kinase)
MNPKPKDMELVLHHECESCPSRMSEIRAKIRTSASAFGFEDDVVHQLVLAIDEACTNIIRYAYDGQTTGKIEIDVAVHPPVWEVRIRDYGKRCDPSKLKGRELDDVRPGGLGLFFIHQAFDHVCFDHSVKKGTCLILRKIRTKKRHIKTA